MPFQCANSCHRTKEVPESSFICIGQLLMGSDIVCAWQHASRSHVIIDVLQSNEARRQQGGSRMLIWSIEVQRLACCASILNTPSTQFL